MEDVIINGAVIKHGLWVVFTIAWLLVNLLQKKEYGFLAGIGNLGITLISTVIYLLFWIIWLIIF